MLDAFDRNFEVTENLKNCINFKAHNPKELYIFKSY